MTNAGAFCPRRGRAGILWTTLRAGFFPASLLPAAVGALLARHQTGLWDGGLFAWTLLGVVLVHASANVANDYFDYRSGNDALNEAYLRPFSGGSRTVQEGLVTPGGLLALALACLALSGIPGLWLAWKAGPVVLAAGLAGALTGWLYTAPPVRLMARGLGELTVALDFGVLPVVTAFYIQARAWSWTPLFLSVPLGLLIAAVLVINQFPDYEADRAVGKRNAVVRLGRRRAVYLFAFLALAWIPALGLAVWAGGAPRSVFVALMAAPLAVPALVTAARHYENPARLRPACACTVGMHAAASALMGFSLVFPKH